MSIFTGIVKFVDYLNWYISWNAYLYVCWNVFCMDIVNDGV